MYIYIYMYIYVYSSACHLFARLAVWLRRDSNERSEFDIISLYLFTHLNR